LFRFSARTNDLSDEACEELIRNWAAKRRLAMSSGNLARNGSTPSGNPARNVTSSIEVTKGNQTAKPVTRNVPIRLTDEPSG